MAKYNVQVEDSEGNQYYPKPDLLTTKEQVSANTAAGKSVDALVVKQIRSDISKVRTYVGSDGKLHFVNSAGADSALPFSRQTKVYSYSVDLTSTTTTSYTVPTARKIVAVGTRWNYPPCNNWWMCDADNSDSFWCRITVSGKTVTVKNIGDNPAYGNYASTVHIYIIFEE